VSRIKYPRFGDYATNAAPILAGPSGLSSQKLAGLIVNGMPQVVADVQIAGPDFINFFLTPGV